MREGLFFNDVVQSFYLITQIMFIAAWAFNFRPDWEWWMILIPTFIVIGFFVFLVLFAALFLIIRGYFYAKKKENDGGPY